MRYNKKNQKTLTAIRTWASKRKTKMTEKKRSGRPIPVWLHDDTLKRADALAARTGEGRATILRLVIKLGLNRIEQIENDEDLAREILGLTKHKKSDKHP